MPRPPPPGRPPLCNRHVVLDGLAQVTLRTIRDAETPVRPALPRIPRSCVWCSSALEKFPSDWYDCRGCCRQTKQRPANLQKRRDKVGWNLQTQRGKVALGGQSPLGGCHRPGRALCAAPPRQSAASASCFSITNTRIWSAVGFAAVRVPVGAAAAHWSLRRAGFAGRVAPASRGDDARSRLNLAGNERYGAVGE